MLPIKKIQRAFKAKGILVKENLGNDKAQSMPESVTNNYLKVKDVKGAEYIVRINGKMWPPFTRQGEAFNLKRLKENHISTTVIVNDAQNGFQICSSANESCRLNKLPTGKRSEALKKISAGIKKFHRVGEFQNNYTIGDNINNCFKRLPEPVKNKLAPHLSIILRLLNTLNSDVENKVPSHNDLLPSSIFLEGDKVLFVDWEYSAVNHCSYDLSFLVCKGSLTPEEEEIFLSAYDPTDKLDLKYSVAMMKPVVNFLLLLWHVTSKEANAVSSNLLLVNLTGSIQDVLFKQSARLLRPETQFSLFHQSNEAEMTKETTAKAPPVLLLEVGPSQ